MHRSGFEGKIESGAPELSGDFAEFADGDYTLVCMSAPMMFSSRCDCSFVNLVLVYRIMRMSICFLLGSALMLCGNDFS
jgi:hypothetical protein